MDKSETYIKQCEKAEEIQCLWECKGGDWYVDTITFPGERIVEIIGGHIPTWEYSEYDYSYKEHQRRSFWLPRQDQLQMLSGLRWQEFDKECLKYGAPTKEQAGIQVVMKILYHKNKVWRDGEWK
uniref:Uncharacterized protein n=1 Tax=viral metagenome TaxID=1070528 RepID=A0A6H2A1H2_9ZZZZ